MKQDRYIQNLVKSETKDKHYYIIVLSLNSFVIMYTYSDDNYSCK